MSDIAEYTIILFESDLPETWIERAQSVLGPAQLLVNAIRQKYFPEEEEDN